jgi:hypothetical protein
VEQVMRQLGHREHVDQVEEQLDVGDPCRTRPRAQQVKRPGLGHDCRAGPPAITARADRCDMTVAKDRDESSDSTENAEPMENADAKDPTEPTESAEPTEPIDRTDPRDPMHRNEFCDHKDQRDEPGPPVPFTAPQRAAISCPSMTS